MEISGATGPVLYVEDDENDVFFVSRALKKANGPALEVVGNGKDAQEFLAQAAQSERSRPGLVLLDLNLPYVSGHEVLAWIRKQPTFGSLPVVVFTSSAQRSDITRAYAAGATAYVIKPNGPTRMSEMVTALLRVLAAPAEAQRILAGEPEFQAPTVSRAKTSA